MTPRRWRRCTCTGWRAACSRRRQPPRPRGHSPQPEPEATPEASPEARPGGGRGLRAEAQPAGMASGRRAARYGKLRSPAARQLPAATCVSQRRCKPCPTRSDPCRPRRIPTSPSSARGTRSACTCAFVRATVERVQEFRGTIIRLRKGGNTANFTVRRTASHGVGVERTFLLRSPLIEKVEVQRKAQRAPGAAVLPARAHGQARPPRREAQGLAGQPPRCSAAGLHLLHCRTYDPTPHRPDLPSELGRRFGRRPGAGPGGLRARRGGCRRAAADPSRSACPRLRCAASTIGWTVSCSQGAAICSRRPTV